MPSDADRLAAGERSTGTTPPYTAYITFDSFLRRAAGEPIPPVVDKALLVAWGIAAGNESGLVTSLRALGIVDDAGRPTELYGQLRLSPPRRAAALERCVELAYPGLAKPADTPIDPNQLHDYFVATRGLTGQMVEKASRFYRQIVTAAKVTGASESLPGPRPSARGVRSTQPAAAQLRLETVEFPPQPTTFRRARARTATAKRGSPPVGIGLQVQVPFDVTESDLVDLFGRIQSAWLKSLRRPSSS